LGKKESNLGKKNKKQKGKSWKKKKKKTKKSKKKEEGTMDYCYNPRSIGCGWTVNHPHPLAYYLIKSIKIILKNK